MKEITIEKDTIHVEKKNVYGNDLIFLCVSVQKDLLYSQDKKLYLMVLYIISKD